MYHLFETLPNHGKLEEPQQSPRKFRTISLQHMWQGVEEQGVSGRPHENPHGRETVPLSQMHLQRLVYLAPRPPQEEGAQHQDHKDVGICLGKIDI